MSHFADDVHHRLSTRIRDIIPDFVESEYPAFASFIKAYYEFLEQYDTLPIKSVYEPQPGLVTVRASNSTILGTNTQFSNTEIYANNAVFRVGSEEYRIRSIANNTQLVVYDVPVRSYFANTHTVEVSRSNRQASGAIRQLLTFHDVDDTLDDFLVYFRNTYLQNIPQGLTETSVLLPRILDFYKSRGSQSSYEFLFYSLYGKDVKFSYPRESVFTTSDNEWVKPTMLRIDIDTATGNVESLETRDIVGLTSNARATVLKVVPAYEGTRYSARTFITDPIISKEEGGLLLEDSSGYLIATKYGAPPEGSESVIYEYELIQEEIGATTFQAGEIVSTLPIEDPDAIRGELVGGIIGFNVEERGYNYKLGDFVYPPSYFANGTSYMGGFGAVGKITEFRDEDIDSILINDPGLGYYRGLRLDVDNTNTGGGAGLSGYVSEISSGHILLPEGGALIFTYDDEEEYFASREKLDYYEVGVSLGDLFGGLSLDSDDINSDGFDLLDETDGRQLLQEVAVPINALVWSNNSTSPVYASNLATPIIQFTANLAVYPLYVRGVRTEVGQISEVTIESFGSGYVSGVPTITVQTPDTPTRDATGLQPLSIFQIFGAPFVTANLSVQKETGQIGAVEVVKSGAGYSNASFYLSGLPLAYPPVTLTTEDGAYLVLEDNSGYLISLVDDAGYGATLSSPAGDGAKLSAILGAVSYGEPYFRNTRSFASADQYVQDITKYQPFSYVLSVEQDLSRYADVLRRLVHPAGGLLLPRQTITTEIESSSVIRVEGVNITIIVDEDLFSIPPSLKTIFVTAPIGKIARSRRLSAGSADPSPDATAYPAVMAPEPPAPTVYTIVRLSTASVSIGSSSPQVKMHLVFKPPATVLEPTAPVVIVHRSIAMTAAVATENAGAVSVQTQVVLPVTTITIDTRAEITAPQATAYAHIGLLIVNDTIIEPYETTPITTYETTPLNVYIEWDAPTSRIAAPDVTGWRTVPISEGGDGVTPIQFHPAP